MGILHGAMGILHGAMGILLMLEKKSYPQGIHYAQPTTPKDSSEEFYFVDTPEKHGFRGRSAGEVRASNKMPAEVCRNRKKVQPLSGRIFPLLQDRRTGKRKTANGKLLECTRRKKRAGRVAVSFVRAATVLELPHPQSLLGVASRGRKDALLIFSRYVSLYFTATLRSAICFHKTRQQDFTTQLFNRVSTPSTCSSHIHVFANIK